MTQDGSEGKGKILKKKRRAALHVLSFRNPDVFLPRRFRRQNQPLVTEKQIRYNGEWKETEKRIGSDVQFKRLYG